MLAEQLLSIFDAMDADTRRIYEIGALAHAGGPKLVDIFLTQVEKTEDTPVKPTLRNYPNTKSESHQSTHNRLQRDSRSHPNYRLNLAISAMMQDASTLHERLFFSTLYLGGCLDVKGHIKLVGLEEEPIREPHYTNADKAVCAEVTDFNKFLTSIREKTDGKSTDQG
jgi:hypothetical protein